MRMAGYICSEDGWPSINKQGKELLENGCSLIVWPEGHRSRDGKLHRFKKGAFQLAYETKKIIVPICITGTYKLLPPKKRLLRPSRIKMIILPPIYPSEHSKADDEISHLRSKTREVIAEELQRRNRPC